jgi:hypothetical protein
MAEAVIAGVGRARERGRDVFERLRLQFYEREVEIVLRGIIRQVRRWARHLRMDRVTERSKFLA